MDVDCTTLFREYFDLAYNVVVEKAVLDTDTGVVDMVVRFNKPIEYISIDIAIAKDGV